MKTLDMTCPQCAATMVLNSDKTEAHCAYCGHRMIIQKPEKPPVQQMTPQDYQEATAFFSLLGMASRWQQRRRKRWGKLRIVLTVVGVFLILAFAVNMAEDLAKPMINPFDGIRITFRGIDGDGELILEEVPSGDAVLSRVDYDISKERNLSEGEQITVTASSQEYRLAESARVYTVEGLDLYLTELEGLPGEALDLIHSQAEQRLEINLERSRNAGYFVNMEPVQLILMTDGKRTNQLYDVLAAHFTTKDGDKTFYMLVQFEDVVVRQGSQVSLDMSYGISLGPMQQVQSSTYLWGFTELEDIRSYILTNLELDLQMQIRELG